MGSLVIDVVHHFPYTMYGGNAHASHESPALQSHHRTTASRQPPSDASNPQTRNPAPSADTPMVDAGSRATSAAPASQPHEQARGSTTSTPGHLIPPAPSENPQSLSEPPPSPRFKGHSHHTPLSAGQSQFTQPRALPSSNNSSTQASPAHSSVRSQNTPAAASPPRIKVRSLSHIQSFAVDETSPLSQAGAASRRLQRGGNDVGPQYEISEMPVADIIEMVAGLLTKITTTNDRQHEHLHRQVPPDDTRGLSQTTTSVLAFHGKNIPSISILSYLSRIHKYCPTTYEVFLSLLVYFDRMTERVNAGPMQSLRQANQQSLERANAVHDGSRHSSISSAALNTSPSEVTHVQAATPPPSGSLGKPAEPGKQPQTEHPPSPPIPISMPSDSDPYNLSHFFVVDSFNIHRLVIAGVTCASKFFSDIFYTNSRYAKVGGLPLPELNHLELQFLLLNDFRLAVPLEEMEAYGTMLVEFYAREVVAQHSLHQPHSGSGHSQVAA